MRLHPEAIPKIGIAVIGIAFIIVSSSASYAPEGSTGCSRKYGWIFTNGWCWRYCKGNSGKWCYTEKGCGRILNEVCATKTTCYSAPDACNGAEQGCVRTCEEADDGSPSQLLEKELSNLPIGSTGCSLKLRHWAPTDGMCWRYCRLNQGDWCYTWGNGCRNDPETCATTTRCKPNHCTSEDREKGCVDQCPNRNTELVLFADKKFRGEMLNMDDVFTCTNIRSLRRQVSSMSFRGSCLRLYSENGCTGRSINISRGHYDDLSKLGFNDMASSVGPC